MKNVKPKTRIMRDDYEFQVTPVRLHHVHPLGFEKLYAAPGDWVVFQPDAESAAISMGRVIGLATVPKNVNDPHGSGLFVMIAALGSRGQVMMRWVRPEWIAAALPGPPKRAMEFLCGEWDDPQKIVSAMDFGILEDYTKKTKKQEPRLDFHIADSTQPPFVALDLDGEQIAVFAPQHRETVVAIVERFNKEAA